MKMIYVAVGIGSAALGFVGGYITKSLRDRKYIKNLVESTQRSIDELSKEVERLRPKKEFIGLKPEERMLPESFPWSKVNDKTGELDDDTIRIEDGEPTETSDLAFRSPEEERENYHAIMSGSMYVDEPYQEDNIIRYSDTVDDGTYEISEVEAQALKHQYPIEDIAYYEASGKLFIDGGEMTNDEISPTIGYTLYELSKRFLKGDTSMIYVQNEAYHKIYRIESLPGLMPE